MATTIADVLFLNVHAFTADEANPSAEAVAVKGNRIVFTGNTKEAQAWRGPGTRLIDGNRCTLMPGFIDSHFHMLLGSLNLDEIHPESAVSYEEFAALLKSYAEEYSDKAWLSGMGLRYNIGPEHIPLTRQHLDALIADRPVFIIAYDGHTAWSNTLALKQAGIFHGGEVGRNSEIVLDDHGEATGELREGAQDRITDLLPKPDAQETRRLLKKGLALASSFGVTSTCNMDGNDEQAAMYAACADTGDLTVRIYIPYSIKPETPFAALANDATALREKYQSPKVRGGCVKLFMDGVIETTTGLLVEPYADDTSTNGNSNYEIEHFDRVVVEADRLGLQICVHAVGDLGVRRVLDAFELAQKTNGKRDSRHRIEHIELIHPVDVHRFAHLGVIASMQPMHAPPRVDDGDVWQWRVGRQRWPYSFAWSTLREAGAVLVFGSDWPVVSQNPLLGVHNTLNRMPWEAGMPAHRQNLADTLLSYTRLAAYAEFEERRKGLLKPGYLADLVLLSEDIFQTPPEKIKTVHPMLTMMDGQIVYEI